MRYLVIVEKSSNGYCAYAPDLPGCAAAGDTREETLELMRGAIEMHLEGMLEDGETPPEPSTTCEVLDIAA
jgi:predicted RNase H-like HicB family nuclease